jgi:NADP-reducing hydrogenase subunit HndB
MNRRETMNSIKSLEELKRVREKALEKFHMKEDGKDKGDIKILIGMATCGLAAGAKEVYEAMEDEIKNKELNNVHIKQVGCLGYCFGEPMVEVCVPGQDPVVYSNVDEKKGREIIKKHIEKGQKLEEGIIEKTFLRI